ncbi:MAG: glycosyltransferase family 25 protein, partial [Devosia sp.]
MRTFYINLTSRPDRRAAMEAQFERLGLAATRVDATTPAALSAADKSAYCDPRKFHWLTEVELACSLSHIEALKAIAAGSEPFGLIFEDDVVLSARLPGFLADFDAAPPPVDLLRIEADPDPMRVDPGEPLRVGGIALRRVYSWSNGAAGYIVSQHAARRIVEARAMLSAQTDRVLFNPFEFVAREKLVMRHTDPAFCIQADRLEQNQDGIAISDIGKARSHRDEMERAL